MCCCFFNQDISTTVTARSFKLGHMIKIMSRLPGENLKKNLFIFWSYCPLRIRALKTCIIDKEFCNQAISNTITARGFKQRPLIEDEE